MQYKIKEAEDTGLQLAAQITDSQNWRRQGMIDAAFELADTIQEVALPERTNMTTVEILL